MTQTAQILRGAADLLDNGGWCQEAFAKARNGRSVKPTHPGACKFCALGSLERAWADTGLTSDNMYAATRAIAEDIHPEPLLIPGSGSAILVSWNDSPDRTGAEVAAQFRATADRLEKEQTQ